jgi:hypothetical protein
MARSTATIQATMDAEQALQTDLTTLNSPSQTAIYRLWKFITSTIINYLEQLWDIYKAELETQISAAAVGSNAWLQSKVMKFQYSASTPQVLAVDSNFAINYPTIDTTLQIITRCSVTTTSQRVCLVKVAKSNPPVALSAPELSSLSGFLSYLNFAGVNYVAQSLTSDKIYIDADIYYNGQYASTISANVITAINAYLASIPFDGKIKLMSLIDAIQAVTGVTDVVLKNVAIRADATAFANKNYLVQNKTSIIPLYQMYAGYATEETTSGYTFTDTLVFIAQ